MLKPFTYRAGQLYAEGVPVAELAERFGTPLYVYSQSHLQGQFQRLTAAMAEVRPLVCYSVKANSNAAVIRTFVEAGAGMDIVSGGELFRARRAGADPAKIVFAGVGKTRAEIEYALAEGILFFTVESEPEAERIDACARRLGVKGRVAFRVNPDVDPRTHQYISTGRKENKFGLDLERVARAYAAAARMPGLEIVGLHMHIGSQILAAQPFAEALRKAAPLCRELQRAHPSFRYLDIGGGLGIDYAPEEAPLDFQAFAGAMAPLLRELKLAVVLEPGRSLVGNGGILVCRVEYVKQNYYKKFIITDAAMNDLIRPSLYQAHHEVLPVADTDRKVLGDLVGPICESGDFFAHDRELPDVRPGDLLAVMSAGAYGFAMSSTYNSRPRAAEVMVAGERAALVRRRETPEDLVRGETPFGERGN
jgi:diaminopimelate decarboxylase